MEKKDMALLIEVEDDFHILTSREMTPEERADILLNGTIQAM